MEPSELLRVAAMKLESLGVNYFTTGSMASILYGEPRFTNDVDIVVDLDDAGVAGICAAFPAPDYYVSESAAHEAVEHRSQLNVIHPDSGLKIDFMVADICEFNEKRFARSQSIEFLPGISARFASPEDVILRKLESYKLGEPDKHLRDIRGILKLCELPVDREYIEQWAAKLDVLDEWRLASEQA
jgi:hypothetical protein